MLIVFTDQTLYFLLTSTSTWPKSWESSSHSFGKWTLAAQQLTLFLQTHYNLSVRCPVRLLLGVQPSSSPPGFLVEPCGSTGLADWELDRLMWSRSVENIATAATTITSLAQLLDQIGNIVINDNIAQQVLCTLIDYFWKYCFEPLFSSNLKCFPTGHVSCSEVHSLCKWAYWTTIGLQTCFVQNSI